VSRPRPGWRHPGTATMWQCRGPDRDDVASSRLRRRRPATHFRRTTPTPRSCRWAASAI